MHLYLRYKRRYAIMFRLNQTLPRHRHFQDIIDPAVSYS